MSRTLLSKVLIGGGAGLFASAAMHGFRVAWERGTHGLPRDAIFGFDQEADTSSAQLLSRIVAGRTISPPKAQQLGMALHYAYGSGMGIVYAAFASRIPVFRSGFGNIFGLFLWIFADELSISLASISDPRKKSYVSHAGALLAHLVFGTMLNATMSASGFFSRDQRSWR